MNSMKEYTLNINGFPVQARYSEYSVKHIWKPFINDMRALYEKKNKRIIVFLVAPPAVGKSTLATFLEMLSKEDGKEEIQAIGLDGFHYSQAYLKHHVVIRDGVEIPMNDVKGCPETFDIDGIQKKMQCMKADNVKWPIYDRNIHDVVPDQIYVNKQIVLIEGNWLLLKDEMWRTLRTLCDYSIQITADVNLLKKRLIERKMRGGLSKEKAITFYEKSDRLNVLRVLHDSQTADMCLRLNENLDFEKGEYL